MRFDLITLFPQLISQFAELGVTGEAIRDARLDLAAWTPRDFAAKGRPDDKSYGGGPGMLMQAQPLAEAVLSAQAAAAPDAIRPVYLMSPQGQPFSQVWAEQLAQQSSGAILICGRYEGVDERFIDAHVDAEVSLGDFVLSGGEWPAMMMIDAVIRLLPEVLGDENSAKDESFIDGTLEYPHYTRPECWQNQRVPPVLLSGNHAKIQRWRAKMAIGRTWEKRPDLLNELALDAQTHALLREYIEEYLAGLNDNATSD